MPRRARSPGLKGVMTLPSHTMVPPHTGGWPPCAARRPVLPPAARTTTCDLRTLPPQLDFDDPLVRRHLIDRTLGQHRALVQACDSDAKLTHERHVVLDHHDGLLPRDLLEQFGSLVRLDVGHAGDRL